MKNKLNWVAVFAILALISFGFLACEGPAGPAGEPGAPGGITVGGNPPRDNIGQGWGSVLTDSGGSVLGEVVWVGDRLIYIQTPGGAFLWISDWQETRPFVFGSEIALSRGNYYMRYGAVPTAGIGSAFGTQGDPIFEQLPMEATAPPTGGFVGLMRQLLGIQLPVDVQYRNMVFFNPREPRYTDLAENSRDIGLWFVMDQDVMRDGETRPVNAPLMVPEERWDARGVRIEPLGEAPTYLPTDHGLLIPITKEDYDEFNLYRFEDLRGPLVITTSGRRELVVDRTVNTVVINPASQGEIGNQRITDLPFIDSTQQVGLRYVIHTSLITDIAALGADTVMNAWSAVAPDGVPRPFMLEDRAATPPPPYINIPLVGRPNPPGPAASGSNNRATLYRALEESLMFDAVGQNFLITRLVNGALYDVFMVGQTILPPRTPYWNNPFTIGSSVGSGENENQIRGINNLGRNIALDITNLLDPTRLLVDRRLVVGPFAGGLDTTPSTIVLFWTSDTWVDNGNTARGVDASGTTVLLAVGTPIALEGSTGIGQLQFSGVNAVTARILATPAASGANAPVNGLTNMIVISNVTRGTQFTITVERRFIPNITASQQITNLTPPENGEPAWGADEPNIHIDNRYWEITGVSWYNVTADAALAVGSNFASSSDYVVTLTLTPTADWAFNPNAPLPVFTQAGGTSIVSPPTLVGGNVLITIDFPTTL